MSIKIKTTKSTENETKKVIRVSLETDKIIQEKLQKLNNDKEEYGKVNKEKLIHFLVENMTSEQAELIRSSTLTWDIEEKRLIKLWSKKHGKLTEKKWKELLYTGQLSEFIKEHSRIVVGSA
jgi:hypothetical protein